jgi:pyruvate/2-oxoglutarate dehydrogenase complex dihydrolipoamide dehydrogenase (E3) component
LNDKTIENIGILPHDEHNKTLLYNVHPAQWKNPEPASSYNLVIIGAGTAGLVTAAGAAMLGARVALIEKNFLGGDCLNFGCVPSKSLIRACRVYAEVRDAHLFGINLSEGAEVDFAAVMERMRRIRALISSHDSAMRFSELGVDVFIGQGRFTGSDAIEVDGKTLKFKKAVIATGARAAELPVPGAKEAGYLTNETVFSLTERPQRLAVIGGGPLGCEMAQAFCRFGSEVVLIQNTPHILDREDADAAEIVQNIFIKEGMRILLNCTIKRIEKNNNTKTIIIESSSHEERVVVDEILVGVGRAPNVEELDLEKADVKYDTKRGVVVNDYLQTTNRSIYAAGDICMRYKFTHTADATARIVVQNALFNGKKSFSSLIIPWCTYTDPEIAHVGMYEKDAQAKGISVETFTRYLSDVDRGVIDSGDQGFVKVHVKKGSDKIIGATIVAPHAGDMISEITLAMVGDMGLKTLSNVIHPYPTHAEAIKQTADLYNRTRLKPFIKKITEKWFSLVR